MNSLIASFALVLAADPVAGDWKSQEDVYLKNIKPLTTSFVRAGEGYFSPDGKQIIYQAEEKDTGNPFYQIFVQDIVTGHFRKISPGLGRTTCAYFHPTMKRVIFASSHEDPDVKKHHEDEYKQRIEDAKNGVRRRYSWDFDKYMKIYESNPDGTDLKCLTPNAKAYTAEGSFSVDGKKIVYSSGNSGNVQLYTMNADGTGVVQLTTKLNCYNGGPFFSPDGTKVIFRSDRKEKDRLQLFVDGKLVSESAPFEATKYDLTNRQPLQIGMGAQDYFRGDLADVRLYRGALSPEKVRELAEQRP